MIRGLPVPDSPQVRLSRQGVLRGARALLPLCPIVALLGMTFGVAARQEGLAPWMAVLMSGVVFAGGSQFVALSLWTAPIPLGALWLATLAVNARHILLGAVLHPWFKALPRWQRYGAVSVLSDANWAWSQQAHARGERDAGVLFGGGVVMWVTWVLGTALGVFLGQAIGQPQRLGLDVLMVAFFATLLVDTWRGRDDLLPWVTAGATSLLVLWLFPHHNWHVLAGALAGAAAGLLHDSAGERHQRRQA